MQRAELPGPSSVGPCPGVVAAPEHATLTCTNMPGLPTRPRRALRSPAALVEQFIETHGGEPAALWQLEGSVGEAPQVRLRFV